MDAVSSGTSLVVDAGLRLPPERMLDRLIVADRVSARQVDALGDVLGEFYRGAAPAGMDEDEYLARLEVEQIINRELLSQMRLPEAPALLSRMDTALSVHAPALGARAQQGRLVHGHGDLRPERVCLLERPVLIESTGADLAWREADPLDELAGLGLECTMLGAPWVGPRLVVRCAGAFGERPSRGLLHTYEAFRALQRARIAVARLLERPVHTPERWLPMARRYLAHARGALDALAVNGGGRRGLG